LRYYDEPKDMLVRALFKAKEEFDKKWTHEPFVNCALSSTKQPVPLPTIFSKAVLHEQGRWRCGFHKRRSSQWWPVYIHMSNHLPSTNEATVLLQATRTGSTSGQHLGNFCQGR
jgi:hypothetical protein